MNSLAHSSETLFNDKETSKSGGLHSLSTGSNFNLLSTTIRYILKRQLENVTQGISKDVQTYPKIPGCIPFDNLDLLTFSLLMLTRIICLFTDE